MEDGLRGGPQGGGLHLVAHVSAEVLIDSPYIRQLECSVLSPYRRISSSKALWSESRLCGMLIGAVYARGLFSTVNAPTGLNGW